MPPRSLARRSRCTLAALCAVAAACEARRSDGTQCVYSAECAAGLVCAGSVCRAACRTDRDCPAGARCHVAAEVAVCLPPDAPTPCRGAADCVPGQVCARDGVCRAECRADRDCAVRAPYLSRPVCRGGTCQQDTALRLIAPISDTVAGMTRIQLQWRKPPDADAVRIEIFTDRAATMRVGSNDPTGEQATFAPLAPRVYYWRATALVAGAPVGAPTPVWQFTVRAGRASAGGTTFAPELDANGDDVPDVLVGAPGASMGYGRVDVFAGQLHAPPAETVSIVTVSGGSALDAVGHALARAGDMNGDGYDDFVVAGGQTFGAVLVLGQPAPMYWMRGPAAAITPLVAPVVAPVGDVDGDGHVEVVVGDNSLTNASVHVLSGQSAAEPFFNARTLAAPPAAAGNAFGFAVAGAGDVNGDGYDDVAVSAVLTDVAGAVYVYLGNNGGLVETPVELRGTGTAQAGFGNAITSAGDVNGDGFADLAVIEPFLLGGGTGHLWLFPGGAGGVAMATRVDVPLPPMPSNVRLRAVAGLGDVNHDGFADLAVGAYDLAGSSGGRVFVYHGSAQGLGPAPATTLSSPDESPGVMTGYGGVVAAVGDVNRDGFADLAVSSPSINHVDVYLGSSTGLTQAAAARLQNPADVGAQFGAALAR